LSAGGGSGPPAATRIALDREDPAGDQRHHRRGKAGARADLEHPVARPQLGRLDHERDDVGLRDGLALADRERRVLVGELLHALLDEGLARHPPHRVEHLRVADAAARKLHVHHAVPGPGEVEHPPPA
jgi:hypothetical protein